MSSLSTKETYHLSVLGVMVGVGSTRKVGGGRSQPQEVGTVDGPSPSSPSDQQEVPSVIN